ncbi:type II secretion system protein [Angustibacter sp. McL0619]|uniref:type II secretion system protein n=1 Tax=Angustibacter sp. McL0619 TaxID=3415676 RepID=UPI003CF0BD6F
MLARIRKSAEEKDQGFTLIELLVVMIIIGILAAIAIPVFLNQRKKAVDTAAKSDVSTIGKEIATYYVDNTVDPTIGLNAANTRYTLTPGAPAAAPAQDIGKQSNKMGTPTLTYPGTGTHDVAWCVTLPITASAGTLTSVFYSAANGLSTTSC